MTDAGRRLHRSFRINSLEESSDATLTRWFTCLAPQPDSAMVDAERETPPPPIPERLLLSVARRAMACEFELLFNQFQYPAAADVAHEVLDLIEGLEGKLSVYKPRSDLSQLNRWGGKRLLPLSPDTLRLLQLARDLHRLTGGAFDVTAGALSEVWGFARRQGKMPSEAELATALQTVGTQYLQLDEAAGAAGLQREGVKVNPGGVGKGYALDRAAGRLVAAEINDFLIHGGLSSVVARGDRQHPETGGGWLVSLRHPWRLEHVLGTIRLRNQALATSGSGKQFFHFGGKRYSHIIDPRSGWPAQTMMSATVLCPSGAVADALATAMFVLGPDASREFCCQHPALAAILIYAKPGAGSFTIETINTSDDMWQPARA